MDELAYIAEKVENISALIDSVCLLLMEDEDCERAYYKLDVLSSSCEEIADRLREIAGEGDFHG